MKKNEFICADKVEFAENGKLKKGTFVCPNCGSLMKFIIPTMQEIEILRLRWKGNSIKEIAESQFLSVKTIESHMTNLKRKVGCRDIGELFRWGLEKGVLNCENKTTQME